MHGEISVPLPIALFGIAEARVSHDFTVYDFFLAERKRAQRFCKKLEALDTNCGLTSSCSKQRTRNTDDIAKIEMLEHREAIFAEMILSEVQLDSSARIGEVREHGLAVCAPRNNATRDGYVRTFLFTRPCSRHVGQRFRSGAIAGIRIREGLDGSALQRIELIASCLQYKVEIVGHAGPLNLFKYASMNGSIPPSMTFWTSGILSSVRWSFTIVYG